MSNESVMVQLADEQPTTERLVTVYLTPVTVFGTGGGYGLGDATEAWSDCSRAIGHIFRVDDLATVGANRVRVKVFVPESELPKLAKDYDDE